MFCIALTREILNPKHKHNCRLWQSGLSPFELFCRFRRIKEIQPGMRSDELRLQASDLPCVSNDKN
ncbi:hypothetical protein CLDAP_26750 [Caldilinea aerophila DSM 14535 = NBRC 104270]|uniref:Uncharacterized protein n=1 Tax=Caldilinea aerophila (strain DSM 14535 / JCM 11387 / NBRC 104270 / STL-6-O1) TaxID=926550 RepID=I0I627_CALAS|nr:hypothetical protein CLDAP_26750 [Caldilinea aerophila DSM 14535 = NBRC 104270]